MSFWNKVKYEFSNSVYVIEKITLNMDLKSASGYTLWRSEFNVEEKEPLVFEKTESWSEYRDARELVEKKGSHKFNNKAKELLLEARKNGIINADNGKVISGKHIVKVCWDLDLALREATFEEWLAFKNNGS